MRRFFTAIIVFLSPSPLAVLFLRLSGHKIGKKVKIGFSILLSKNISIEGNSRIGHFNLFLNESTILKGDNRVGYLNILKGPFKLVLSKEASLGNKNYFTRAKKGITYGESELFVGEFTKITVGHHIDLTRSVYFGDFSILAGINSQVWTHGYYHAKDGKDRIRIDGEVKIGDNVYVGSGCIFNPGTSVSNAIHIGGGCVISKDLDKEGMYVSQGLRYIENSFENVKGKLNKIEGYELVEKVYSK